MKFIILVSCLNLAAYGTIWSYLINEWKSAWEQLDDEYYFHKV